MITRVSGQNFLPFREPFEFRLDDQGLVLIRGDNRISAAANDNGSGKTSIPGAVAWCLWGEDLLGRKADAVANRFTEDECFVTVEQVDAIGEWSVTRSRRPAGLAVTGLDVPKDSNMDVVQAAIDSRLGFGLRTFRNAVIFGQGTFDRFATADQAEQLKMLDEIQGIDFTGARKRTKVWRDKLVAQHGEIMHGIEMDSESLTSKRREVVTLTGLRDTYDGLKRRVLNELNMRMRGLVADVTAAEGAVRTVEADAKRLEVMRVEDNKCTDLDGLLSLAKQKEQDTGRLQDEAGRDLRRFDEDLESLFRDAACPKCRGKVDNAPRIRERFAKDRAVLAREQERAAKDYRKALGATAAALEALEAQLAVRAVAAGLEPGPLGSGSNASQVIYDLGVRCSPREQKRLREAVLVARLAVVKLRADTERAEGEVWDGAKALDNAEQNVVLLTARIAREQGRLDRLDTALTIADYCTEAFSDRGLRSLLADSVADFLNERMAWHLLALTAGEAKNVMSSQTVLKKGGARERISFTPSWAWGGEGAGTGSAGQDRRVDLATFASVQDLAESRSARPFPLKVYDEPFDALDSRGKEMACAWLREQAKTYGTVLLITHSEELAALADPDRVWTVVHNDKGARVEISPSR